jgi:ribose transport system permease protein
VTSSSAQAAAAEAPERRWLQLAVVRDYGIVVAFVVLFVVLSIASDPFLTKQNLINVAFQAAPIGIMAAGGTLVFIAGGFDLSVGAMSAFAGIIAAKLFQHTGLGLWPSLVVGALVGLGFGVGNGIITTAGRINAFIATLATSIIIRGIAIAVTGGFLVSIDDESFGTLGLGEVWGVEYPIFVWLGFALFCGLLLSRMTFGRYVYAAGGNPEAARLAGVRVGWVRGACFAISGLSAGIAGVILTSQVATAQADANPLIEFDVITAVVLGGVSILGGEGAVWRSVLGALFLQMIGNGFNLLNVTPVYQQVFKGAILLAAVGLDAWVRRTRS